MRTTEKGNPFSTRLLRRVAINDVRTMRATMRRMGRDPGPVRLSEVRELVRTWRSWSLQFCNDGGGR